MIPGFKRGELWGDGSGASKELTTSFVVGDGTPIRVRGPVDLFCKAAVSAQNASKIEIQAEWAPPGSTDFLPIPSVSDGVTELRFGTRTYAIDSPVIGNYSLIIHIPHDMDVRFKALRVDGAGPPATQLLLTAYAAHAGNGSILGALGAGSGAGASQQLLSSIVFDDGFENPKTLTGVFDYGPFFWLGDADMVELLVQKTTVNVPTYVDLDVQTSIDGSTVYQTTQVNSVASGFDERESSIKRIAGMTVAEDNRSVVIEGLAPLQFFRVGARFIGGVAPDLLVIARAIRR